MSVISQRIFSEIESTPEPFQAEVLDFVILLKARKGDGVVTFRLSRVEP